jgi:hypothetical protein
MKYLDRIASLSVVVAVVVFLSLVARGDFARRAPSPATNINTA